MSEETHPPTIEERLLQIQQEQAKLLTQINGKLGTILNIIVIVLIISLVAAACTALGLTG